MYKLELHHENLNNNRIIADADRRIVEKKARAWETARGVTVLAKEAANDQTAKAEPTIAELERVLIDALEHPGIFEWHNLKFNDAYNQAPPEPPIAPDFPPEPQASEFIPKTSFFWRVWQAERAFPAHHMEWQIECERLRQQAAVAKARYLAQLQEWQKARDELGEDAAFRQAYDRLCARHSAGDSAAIKDICDIILRNSKYPDYFPSDWNLDFDLQTGTLFIEFRLPSIAEMPTFKEVKYDISRMHL
ncbi:MAG: hypothetical protein ACR2KT_12530 [Methylocella sp.]|nr:MAG: hypothetical protein DLM68_12015 [Hyphomicrobiales bacterium]